MHALDQMHKTFIHDDMITSEHEEPFSTRYEEAVLAFPPLARRKLYEDCSDLYKMAYEGSSGEALVAALNFCFLQKHFWTYVLGSDMTPGHAFGIQANNCDLWITRLAGRQYETKPWRWGGKNDTRLLKPKLPSTDDTERQIVH